MHEARNLKKQQPGPSRLWLQYFKLAAAIAIVCLATCAWAVQDKPAGAAKRPARPSSGQPSSRQKASPHQEKPWFQELDKYPGLLAEFAHLQTKLQQELKLPAMRGPSRLLPLLPESTVAYVALPNYGDAFHQALQIFHQELQESTVLRNWWQHVDFGTSYPGASGSLAKTEPKAKIEDGLEKLYQFSQYLGDEIVLSVSIKDPDKSGLILAEIKKPGLQAFLQHLDKELSGKADPSLRVFDPQELAAAKDDHASHEPIVLVRSDFMVIGFDLSALRAFNAQIDGGGGRFASTPFGRRLAQTYQGGAGSLLGADLQRLLSLLPVSAKDQLFFQRSGFADLKYMIWEHKDVNGQGSSQGELSFTGPRYGIASWLASSAPLGSLDFVSPKATVAEAFLLKSPAQIFEEVKDLVNSGKPGAFAGLEQAEQGFQMSLKDDLLGKLSGEIAFELDGPMQPTPAQPIPSFKLILGVKDAEGLQQTMNRLLAVAGMVPKPREEGGLTYYAIPVPNPQKPMEAAYAFRDGYMIITLSPDQLLEADRIHRTGESLAKSTAFRASLPAGHSADASAVVYEDLGAVIGPMLSQLSPELAQFLPQLTDIKPLVMFAYGDETSFRWASSDSKFDLGVVMVAAAIAIPNLLKARSSANEAAAATSVRTVNTAQVMYTTTYGNRGYAPDLATLGPGSSGDCITNNSISDEHACLLDANLGGTNCTTGIWCTKGGFRYSVIGTCRKQAATGKQSCMDYVVVATPTSTESGGKNFCSTSDAVVRAKHGPPLKSPVSVAVCQSWAPI